MKKFYLCQGLVVGTVLLGSCQSEKAPFYFSSRPASVAVQPVVASTPAMPVKPLPLGTPELQTQPSRLSDKSVARVPKRMAVIAKAAAIPLVSTRRFVTHPNHLQHASKRHYSKRHDAPKEGGAKASQVILRLFAVLAIVTGMGLVLGASSGGIAILGASLIVAGLVIAILIALSKDYASKQHDAPKEGRAKTSRVILRLFAVLAILLGIGLLSNPWGVATGITILGLGLIVTGLLIAILIALSKN